MQTVLSAWTDVCRQNFAIWEVQTIWNLLKNVWYVLISHVLIKKKKKKKKKKH